MYRPFNLILCLYLFITLSIASSTMADDGYFVHNPDGYTVFPAFNTTIKMVSETVSIYVPKFLDDPEYGIVNVTAIFNFINSSSDTQIVTMGFPFTMPQLDDPGGVDGYKTWVKYRDNFTSNMNFKVSVNDTLTEIVVKKSAYGKRLNLMKPKRDIVHYANRYITDDPWIVYTWDTRFLPKQNKRIICSYSTPISYGGSSNGEKEQSFSYVAITGSLWKGTIGKAVFKYYIPQRYFSNIKWNDQRLSGSNPFIVSLDTTAFTYAIEDTFTVFTCAKSKWEPLKSDDVGYHLRIYGQHMLSPYCYYNYFKHQYIGNQRSYSLSNLIPPSNILLNISRSVLWAGVQEQNSYFVVQFLDLLKNEIYAREGRAFSNSALRCFWGSYGWYKPRDTVVLSAIENNNLFLIKHYKDNIEDLVWFVDLMSKWDGRFRAEDSTALEINNADTISTEMRNIAKTIYIATFKKILDDSTATMDFNLQNWVDYMVDRPHYYKARPEMYREFIDKLERIH